MAKSNSINFNTNTNHPLIQNSQEYMFYKKHISIHSEDRDMIKYPNSSEFEIELPQDLLNVASIKLIDWSFPANYDTFSVLNSNITMSFIINKPYNPNINNVSDIYIQKVFEFLYLNQNTQIFIVIEEGFYNPQQMVTELTNKFNYEVTKNIISYFNSQIINPDNTFQQKQEYKQVLQEINTNGGYQNFIIVYNNVNQKIWFGNICDGFILTNETQVVKSNFENLNCGVKNQLPDFSSWGLPNNLGLNRCNLESISDISNNLNLSRFYYGDVFPGDNGYWLQPNLKYINSKVYWIEATHKINLMGPAYFYMEIEGQNNIDETSPFNLSSFTQQTNITNGVVNSAFAKIAIPTTPISQWFDHNCYSYKFYYPPAERMRRFKFKFRYHNGMLINFGVFNFTFTLEFLLQMPQLLRHINNKIYPYQ